MKLFVFLVLLLCSFSLSAQVLEKEDCLEAAQVHGGINKIDDSCFEILKKEDDFFQKGEFTEVYLTETILWIRKGMEEKVLTKIAGQKTQLNNIFSIILDEKKDVAIILKKHEKGIDLVVHSLNKDGNVSPFIKTHLKGMSEVMAYYYDQESATFFVEEAKGEISRAFRFDWSDSVMAKGQAKLVEIENMEEIDRQ